MHLVPVYEYYIPSVSDFVVGGVAETVGEVATLGVGAVFVDDVV